jgi:hypothetical protein
MTVKEQLTKMIVARGLFDHMAETILAAYVDNKDLTEVYHKPWADYPVQFHTAAWMVVSQAVVGHLHRVMEDYGQFNQRSTLTTP